MKNVRKYLTAAWLILAIFLVGCTFNSKLANQEVSKSKDEVKHDDIIFRLVSEKEEYKEGEGVQLYGEIEYVGDKEEVEISRSSIYFAVEEKIREFEIKQETGDQSILTKTTLKKGEPLRIAYEREALYSPKNDSDSYIKFIQRFIDEGFPPGYYEVHGHTNLLIGSEEEGEKREKVKLETTIDFKVVE